MLSKEPTRSYNSESLEKWFQYIQVDWEALFDEVALAEGRNLYLGGSIRGVELSKNTATIHYARSRKEVFYSIIDWVDGSFRVRSSTTDQDLGNLIAVGGLYEIEELVADEISPIGKFFDCVESDPSQPRKRATQRKSENRRVLDRANDQLALEFFGSEKGLLMKAFWRNSSGQTRSVFETDLPIIGEAEREQMVQLTVLTREVGFHYQKKKDCFILDDFERIAGFFSHGMQRWKSIIKDLTLDAGAKEMAQGLQQVEILGRAEGSGQQKMQLNYQFRLGSDWMDQDEVQRLVSAKKGTHYLKGRGIVQIKEGQSRALKHWEVSFDPNKVNEWPRYMLYSLWVDKGINLDLAGELKRWRVRLLSQGSKQDEFKEELPEFLRTYQVEGVTWLKHIHHNGGHALLADEMGLGKTLQVLTLINYCAEFKRSSLIVCPASVVPVWKSEVERWYPKLKVRILKSDQMPNKEKGILWISSYSLLRRNIEAVKKVQFEYLILDEAQCIKNPLAKVSQACFALKGQYRLAITGTPLENKLLDLWSIFNFLMPNLMGTLQQFETALQSENSTGASEFSLHVKEQISPFVLRRLKERVAQELPEKTEVDIICPIEDAQKTFYNAYLNSGISSLDSSGSGFIDKEKRFNLFSLLTRLRQVCCDPGIIPNVDFPIESSGKVLVLLSRLSEAFDGRKKRKVVIFSQFVKLLDRLKPVLSKRFPETQIFELKGSTRDRSQPVKAFQNERESAIILVSLKAGGTGVTLNTADYLFLMDPWWNPAVENQAIDRVHRMGQTLPVFIFRMITKGTIEERIQKLKSEKRALFDSTFNDVNMVKDIHEYFGNLNHLTALEAEESGE